MLEHRFDAPSTLGPFLRDSIGAYVDGFAGRLNEEGYALKTTRGHVHSAAHLGSFLQTRGHTIGSVDENALDEFRQHLPRCRCPQSGGGIGRAALDGARLFFEYLRDVGAIQVAIDKAGKARLPPLVESFWQWLEQQCGYAQSTLEPPPVWWTPLMRRRCLEESP